jgi:hypothetical protein
MANTKNFIAKNGFSTGDGYAMPDVRPSLLLDFANSKTLDPRITFTRGSTSTYWDGHTTTKAEENLSTNSQTIANLTQTNTTATDNDASAPDGTTTATKIVVNSTTNAFHDAYLNAQSTVTGVPYTHSVYAKAGTGVSAVYLYGTIGGTGLIAKFNISTGAYIGNASGDGYDAFDSYAITDVGNGWYRIQATKTETSGASRAFTLGVSNTTTDDVTQYNGNGTNFCHLWGVQIEQRSSATAYTATTSSPIVKYQPTLQTAASGEARFDHDPVTGESKGLLIEESRTNLANWSEVASNFYSGNLSDQMYDNAGIAPDGTHTADLVHESNINEHQSVYGLIGGISASTAYTRSCHFKSRGSRYICLQQYDGVTNYATTYDLQEGAVVATQGSATGTIEDIGNGWFRCSQTFTTASNSNGAERIQIGIPTGANSTIQQVGDGWSGVLFWGWQLEAGSFPTSYIATSGSTVTRSADDASITDMSTISPSGEGTLFADAFSRRPVSAHSSSYIIARLSYDTNNYVDLRYRASGASGETVTALGSSKISATSVNPAAEVDVKLVVSYSYDSFAAAGNGSSVTTATGTALPELTSMDIGSLSGVNNMSGTIKKIAFYPQRLSNATLQQMTEE